MDVSNLVVLFAVVAAAMGIYTASKRGANFSILALGALTLGVPIGLLGQGHSDYIEPIGRIYLNLLMACVAPLIVISIISAIVSLGSIQKLRTIGLRSSGWLLLSNALGVVLALGLALSVGIGSGVNAQLGDAQVAMVENSVANVEQVVIDFFPVNLAGDFGANRIIPLIIVAVAVGVAYLQLKERKGDRVRPFRTGIDALKLVTFKAVSYVIKLTPYAIVALTAEVVAASDNRGAKFWSLAGLLGLAWGACFAHTFLVNTVLLRVFAQVNPLAFFRKFVPAQLTAFSTQSSVGTLPVTTAVLTRRVGVHQEVAHFTAPLGTTVGMPGCSGIWPIVIAVWGINAYGLSYSVQDYLILALLATVVSIGTAGVPGTATVAAATVLAAAGLPLEFVAVTLPISMIADMARTTTNVTAAAVAATVVARQTGLLDDEVFARPNVAGDLDPEAESDEELPSKEDTAAVLAEAEAAATTPSPHHEPAELVGTATSRSQS